jgi:hypothetical protein
MKTGQLLFVLALLFALFFIGPAFLSSPFALNELMKTGDALDLLTPVVLMPVYLLILRRASKEAQAMLIFVLISAVWVEGQGMHLAANSIGHHFLSDDALQLTSFYDETLSHYIWHFGIMAMAALLMLVEARSGVQIDLEGRGWMYAGAILYGFTFFLIVIEGVTVPMGLPFAVVVSIYGISRWKKRGPIATFLTVGSLVAVLFFLGWGLYWGGFPEFSEVGIL